MKRTKFDTMLVFIISLVMALTMAVPVWADPGQEPGPVDPLEVENPEDPTQPSVTDPTTAKPTTTKPTTTKPTTTKPKTLTGWQKIGFGNPLNVRSNTALISFVCISVDVYNHLFVRITSSGLPDAFHRLRPELAHLLRKVLGILELALAHPLATHPLDRLTHGAHAQV